MSFINSEKVLFFRNMLASKFLNKRKGELVPKTILVVKWDEFGDMATSTHVFELLKRKFPSSNLTLLCKPFVRSLVENDPFIDSIICQPTDWNKRYDVVIELRGTKETLRKSFQFKPAYRVDRGTVRFRNRGKQKQEVHINYEIIAPIIGELPLVAPKLYPIAKHRDVAKAFMESKGLNKFAVVHAGARRELRRWKPQYFAQIIDFLDGTYGMDVVLVGGKEDLPLNKEIQNLAGANCYIYPEETSLLDFAALVDSANFFLGNESGPLHIASCMETPLIGLYGPGVERVFYPYFAKSQVIHHVLDCNPCDQVHCVTPDYTCMDRIGVEEVKKAIKDLI